MMERTNLGLNIGTMIVVLIALIAGSFIAADIYDLVHKTVDQTQQNTKRIDITIQAINKSYTQLILAQADANNRGNITLQYFQNIFNKVINSEDNIIGNLTHHRIIANQTRDRQIDILNQILNKTH